jgi:hypothetical protein
MRPLTGLIVKFNPANGRWEDERGAAGPNWDPQIGFNLPDKDVFLIDALAATPALFSGANNVVHVGTVIFNMAGAARQRARLRQQHRRAEPGALRAAHRRPPAAACRATSSTARSASSTAPSRRRIT